MPKAQRTSSRLKAKDTPLRLRKFAVNEKQVIEKIVVEGDQVTAVPAQDTTEGTSKTLKRKLRHDAWLEKLDTAYTAKQKQKKKADRNKQALKTNLDSFADILNTIQVQKKPEVEPKAQESIPVKPAVTPSTAFKSGKARRKAEMQEILRFQKVMQHSAFKQNPLATIRQHVQNTFASESS
ncbi:ribosome biogenesis protein SLX9-domain-containing protein [Spinellus fusiger]|nr:ribosome biogenesis protein SLX9-domain-containing protein [Spinellus fusiger]